MTPWEIFKIPIGYRRSGFGGRVFSCQLRRDIVGRQGPVEGQQGLRPCHYCGMERVFLSSGRRLKDGSIVYVDENGQRWSGRRCPLCERGRVKQALRCGPLERKLVEEALRREGYEILGTGWPLKVLDDNGAMMRVGVRFVAADGSQLVVDASESQDADIYALIFHAVRLAKPSELEALADRLQPLEHVQVSLSGPATHPSMDP